MVNAVRERTRSRSHGQGQGPQGRSQRQGGPVGRPPRAGRQAQPQARGLRGQAARAAREARRAAGMGAARGQEDLHRVRGTGRRRQRRRHQGHHRQGESARIPRGRTPRTDRAREIANVHSAILAAPAGRRRDRDLRPQLVQSRRGRARHGLLHARGGQALSQHRPACREGHGRLRDHPAQVLARGESRGAGEAAQGAHRRRPQDLEALEDGLEVVYALG